VAIENTSQQHRTFRAHCCNRLSYSVRDDYTPLTGGFLTLSAIVKNRISISLLIRSSVDCCSYLLIMSSIIELYKKAEKASDRREAQRIIAEAELLKLFKSTSN
jgi:hypothetical protein